MIPRILDGKWLSERVLDDVAREVGVLKTECGRVPGLGVILVGDNPASATYVKNKEKTALRCGLNAVDVRLPASAGFDEVKNAIKEFNSRDDIDGILLQLPVPRQLDSNALICAIDPHKDADGLHPHNQGLLMGGSGALRPCTPLGVMRLIDLAYSHFNSGDQMHFSELAQCDLSGKRALVIGRSILVGKPVSLLLLERNATVVMAHSKTSNISSLAKDADIVVAAVGVPRLVKGSWLNSGAVVIDVGINRDESSGKLVGDVDYESAAPACSAITPVPGGVGPMTVAMLIRNTLIAFRRRTGRDKSPAIPQHA